MPRPVAIRVSYREDAGHLLRLEAAVDKDDRQSLDWRKETTGLLRKLAMRLLEADAAKNRGESDKSEGRSSSVKTVKK